MTQVISRKGFVVDQWKGIEAPQLEEYTGGQALLLLPDDDPAEAAAHFATLDLIVIPFDNNTDGRGFSLAATLRALAYTGHLRARGHVLVDQFRAALRSGFDDIEISAAQAQRNPEPQWLEVPHTAGYQSHVFA